MRSVWNLLVTNLLRAFAALLLVCAIGTLLPGDASAQEINFDQINKFESLGTGTLHVGAPAKTIIDDGERRRRCILPVVGYNALRTASAAMSAIGTRGMPALSTNVRSRG